MGPFKISGSRWVAALSTAGASFFLQYLQHEFDTHFREVRLNGSSVEARKPIWSLNYKDPLLGVSSADIRLKETPEGYEVSYDCTTGKGWGVFLFAVPVWAVMLGGLQHLPIGFVAAGALAAVSLLLSYCRAAANVDAVIARGLENLPPRADTGSRSE